MEAALQLPGCLPTAENLLDYSLFIDETQIGSPLATDVELAESSSLGLNRFTFAPLWNEGEDADDSPLYPDHPFDPLLPSPPPSDQELLFGLPYVTSIDETLVSTDKPELHLDLAQTLANPTTVLGLLTPRISDVSIEPMATDLTRERGSHAGDEQAQQPLQRQDQLAKVGSTWLPKRLRKCQRKSLQKPVRTIASSEKAALAPVKNERRERHLASNRKAAHKCRVKKKAHIDNLEVEARDLSSLHRDLQRLVGTLKDETMDLRNEMLQHGSCDCIGIRSYLKHESDVLVSARSSPDLSV